jgi:hypothetical protein
VSHSSWARVRRARGSCVGASDLDSPGVGPPGYDWVGGMTLGLLGPLIIGRAAVLPGAGSSYAQRVP